MSLHIPENWTFKRNNVAINFDEHIVEQLPWYPMVTDMVAHIARAYLPQSGTLVDLGCSTGNVSISLKKTITDRGIKVVPIDNSSEMAKSYKGLGKVEVMDVIEYRGLHDVAVMMLTLMFLPVAHRDEFVKRIVKNTKKGGAIIVVDKYEGNIGYIGTVLSRLSISNKLAAGADPEKIIKKELSITGVQRPIKTKFLESQGFVKFFQAGEFVGYVLEK